MSGKSLLLLLLFILTANEFSPGDSGSLGLLPSSEVCDNRMPEETTKNDLMDCMIVIICKQLWLRVFSIK
jgi:hypothetical protein